MNYESIAKMVHEYVKKPISLLAQENRLAENEVKTKELSIIQNVFSKYEVSGDVISFGVTTLEFWY